MKILKDKPKEHLIEEIKKLRQRITELELSETELQQAVNEKENIILTLSSGEDITEHKNIEQELCESEELYRKIFQQSVEAIYMFNPETKRVVEANNAFLDLLGYKKEETLTLTLYDFVVHKKENIDAYIYHILTSGAIIVGERIWRRKDKTMIDLWVTASKIQRKGKFLCFVVAHDITERKRMEQSLQDTAHSLGDRVKELNCLYGISNLASRKDITLEEILQGVINLIPSAWQYPDITCARIVLEGREFRTKNFQETAWKQNSAIIVHSKRAGMVEVCYLETRPACDEGTFRKEERNLIDAIAERVGKITERKRVEEALRQSEDRYRKQFEEAIDAIFMADLGTGMLVDCNIAASKLVEREKSEIIGKHQSFLHPAKDIKDGFSKTFKNHMTGNSSGLLEDKVITKSGQIKDVAIRASKLTIDGKEFMQGIFRDITEYKQAENELFSAKERLQTLSKSSLKTLEKERRYIARELHDEIGQDLTAITIHLENMQHLPNSTVYMNHINENLAIIDRLIQKVRNLSFDLRPPILDDLGIVPALRWYFSRIEKEEKLSIHFVANFSDHRMPVEIETACFRVVQEALTNVVRHAKARQVTIELKQEEKELQLTVSDDGIGFDVKSAQKRALLGESFGLLGMQERVALVGGTIEIESMLSRGTKVIAFFPLNGY
jgi:PAS domain S-box-containing protein